MLAIKRRRGERIRLRMPDGSECWITYVGGAPGGEIRLSIDAPRAVGKRPHDTEAKARAHERALRRSGKIREREGLRLETYWCSRCAAFHVGHRPVKQQRRRA
jgi:hypothetical protein